MLKVVLVGCGSISREELRGLTSHSQVEVVGLVDLLVENATRRKAEFGLDGAETGANLEAMLLRHRPDIVVDCTVPAAHAGVACMALAHGAHVLGQKPMADTLANARRAADAARVSGRTYGIIQTGRFERTTRALRDFVASGVIGDVTTVEFRYFTAMHFPQGDFRNTMPHVLLLDLAIHGFDQVRFVTGTRALTAWCREWNPDSSWFERDACAAAFFQMERDVKLVYHGSWCAEGFNGRRWRINGTRGSIEADGEAIRAERVAKSGGFRSEMEAVPVESPALDEHRTGHTGAVHDFVDAILNGRAPISPCTDNFNSLAMVHAAIMSSESGREVDVESL